MNRNIILKIVITLFVLSFIQACELVKDIDTTDNKSSISVKPFIQIIGEPILSFSKGSTYNEKGAKASEISPGGNDLQYKIVEGKVNPDSIGFYVVKYQAKNTYGWVNYAYRAVLVYGDQPYRIDISGEYKKGFSLGDGTYKFESSIDKHSSINGFWVIDNVYQEGNVTLPVTFADMGDGIYNIVPGQHETKGSYRGTGKKIGNKIQFSLWFTSKSGEVANEPNVFKWDPKP